MKQSINPFAKAITKEEKEKVWNALKSKAKRISREEGELLTRAAIEAQKSNRR